MRFLLVSAAIHALVVWGFVRLADDEDADEKPVKPRAVAVGPHDVHASTEAPTPMMVEVVHTTTVGGSGSRLVSRAASSRSRDPWRELAITMDKPDSEGGGSSGATGGNGIGFGNGGGVGLAGDVPPPPLPVEKPVSRARPARLIWPNRDLDVADESYLFVARVTIDEGGSVVGARMITTRPGSRGEHAANAIWQFRYSPALDDLGVPVRSSFEQPFQVR